MHKKKKTKFIMNVHEMRKKESFNSHLEMKSCSEREYARIVAKKKKV